MDNKMILVGVGVFVVILVVGYLILGKSSYTPAGTTTAPQITGGSTSIAPTTIGGSSTVNFQNTTVFPIVETDYKITPNVITVNAGDTVVLNIWNHGQVGHDVYVDAPNPYARVSSIVSPGQNSTLTFTAPPSGNYTYYCNVDGHKDFGMTGTLVVR